MFVGGSFVDEESSVDYTVDGFCAPPHGAVEGSATIAALEGDANLTGEDFAIGETAMSTFTSLSGPNNPENNFFCSQINDNDGMLDTAGSFGDHNHDPFAGLNIPGARQGWDHTTVAVSSSDGHVTNDQKSAVLRTTTNGDSYFPVLVALELDVKSPDFSDSITEASREVVKLGDTFTVKTTLANSGEALADDLILALPIDGGLELIGFTIDGNVGDANGNNVTSDNLGAGIDSGVLEVGQLVTIELEVEVIAPPDNGVDYQFAPDWGHSFTMCTSDPAIDEMFAGPSVAVAYEADDGTPETPMEEPETEPIPETEPAGDDNIREGSCGCETPGNDSDPAGGALAIIALGAAVAMRRRRQS